ncbi:NAD-dependent dehydratase [Trinickia dabaoshanensis]|uniref:NAD-dependent dehydratase n=1 Tax=Trinickia dabaoshanensis TaxID=564714 RepID=A0A2N7VGS6_9BURK|nr:SDR family oxidoreductase [Trinickia dabaoshanensis]PMS16349.1 NAD-dependent dehydratase [Trinickia dabaoshanensis]
MKVLVCGASGFIGSAICRRLSDEEHEVVRGVRRAERVGDVAIDYATDVTVEAWLDKLRGIDAVVNAAGIIVERGPQTFARMHAEAPIALFTACRLQGVRHVVQISALGAQSRETPYFASKCRADEFLLSDEGPAKAHVIRPALVYGSQGTSARFFRALASVPVHFLPGGGEQVLRPVHIDDLCDLVAKLLNSSGTVSSSCIEAVGATEVTYREMLKIYRESMGLPAAFSVRVAPAVMRISAACGAKVPGAMLTPDTWRMLQRGNTAAPGPFATALGRTPRGIETFIGAGEARSSRIEALAGWHALLLRIALAIVWIGTAFVSAVAYPQAASLERLSRFGLHGFAAHVALYGACALDLAFGMATLIKPGRVLWLVQATLIAAYTLLIAVVLPEFLIEPFAPILKNVPILAILFILFSQETRA